MQHPLPTGTRLEVDVLSTLSATTDGITGPTQDGACPEVGAGRALEEARRLDQRWRAQRALRVRRYLRLVERLEQAEERAFPWLCLTLLVVEPLLLLAAFWVLCVSSHQTRQHVEAAFLQGESHLICAVAIAAVLGLTFCVTVPQRLVTLFRVLLVSWADRYAIEVTSPLDSAARR